MKPDFATNSPGQTVAESLNGYFAMLRSSLAEPPVVWIASAYFNLGGFQLLADELEKMGSVLLLLGAEPTDATTRPRGLASDPRDGVRAARKRVQNALLVHERTLASERDLLGFTAQETAGARRLIEWLESGKVQVKRLTADFLHGKAYIVKTNDDGVIAGSSNFTYAGLARNVELNLGQFQPGVVGQVQTWFGDLWSEAEPFDLASLYKARFDPHSPWLVHLRMLWERYGDELHHEEEEEGVLLTEFGRDGVWRAKQILERRKGVLVADEVGLGKTFLAGELVRQAMDERRQRVAIVAPAALRDGMWRSFLKDHNLNPCLVSFEQLANDEALNPDGTGFGLHYPPNEYALVVVDEAHNLRNPDTQRAAALRQLLIGSPQKDLVLLTATPVNNSLMDLHELLSYFLRSDAAFLDKGISSMREHFLAAMAEDPDDLSPAHLFDIIDDVAVRRTRRFIKQYYPNATIPDGKGGHSTITFPAPEVKRVDYDLDSALPGLLDRLAAALDDPAPGVGGRKSDVLTLARYTPSAYLKSGGSDVHEFQLAGLLRSGLLKRFESSAKAFANTCRTMARSHDSFLDLLDEGYVATGAVLQGWIATDSDEDGEAAAFVASNKADMEAAALYDVEALRADVRADAELLRDLGNEARRLAAEDDPKLQAVVEQLAAIAAEAEQESLDDEDARDKAKVLIFSYYADTVDWIEEYLAERVETDERLARYRGRTTALKGGDDARATVVWGFAPKTSQPPPNRAEDKFDILVTTDVLAEGVNLQQCRHIINYDLPWNPMRLVQRHGRIDRIGSLHRRIYMRCVFPDRQLDDLLGLEERLQRKIKQAAAAVGVENEIIPGSRTEEVTFAHTREEIAKLREENPELFEEGGRGESAISGEEYRQELKQQLADARIASDVKALAWGSGSGFAVEADPGYVFCLRVGDHQEPLFRFVPLDDPGEPDVEDDTLACLSRSRPPHGVQTERVMDEAILQGAFVAWEAARDDVVANWNHRADPANIAPEVPKAMRDARELVFEHGTGVLDGSRQKALIEIIETPRPERVLREVRSVLRQDVTPPERVKALDELVKTLGLEPVPAAKPLPEIDHDDVHLVCWLARVWSGDQ